MGRAYCLAGEGWGRRSLNYYYLRDIFAVTPQSSFCGLTAILTSQVSLSCILFSYARPGTPWAFSQEGRTHRGL